MRLEALVKAKESVSDLICAIEGHHATSTGDTQALFATASRHYKTLDTIREAINAPAQRCDMPAELLALLQAAEEWELAHGAAGREDYEAKERMLRTAIQDWLASGKVGK